MRSKIFILLICVLPIIAQSQSVTYSLEWIRPDSFFLVENISQTFQGSPRPQEVTTAIPFRDTSQLSNFYLRIEAEAKDAYAEFQKIQAKSVFMSQRLMAMNLLRKNGTWLLPLTRPPAEVIEVPTVEVVKTKKKKKK